MPARAATGMICTAANPLSLASARAASMMAAYRAARRAVSRAVRRYAMECPQSVGWVERSETHHRHFRKAPPVMGFASFDKRTGAQPILRALSDQRIVP